LLAVVLAVGYNGDFGNPVRVCCYGGGKERFRNAGFYEGTQYALLAELQGHVEVGGGSRQFRVLLSFLPPEE